MTQTANCHICGLQSFGKYRCEKCRKLVNGYKRKTPSAKMLFMFDRAVDIIYRRLIGFPYEWQIMIIEEVKNKMEKERCLTQ